MRALVLAHSFPRFPGDTHGPFVMRLSEELADLGHEITVLVPWDRDLRGLPDSPLRIESFRYAWPSFLHLLGYSRTMERDRGMKLLAWALSPLYFAFAERALARLVVQRHIELIHAHWILPNGYVAARVSRRLGVPFVSTLHGTDVFMAERARFLGAMARSALATASHVTSCSPDLRHRLLTVADPHGVAAEKVSLLPNGTDLMPPASPSAVAAVRQRLGLDSDQTLVVAVGRLVDKKGFDILVAALPALVAGRPQVRLVIGGGGPLEAPLRAQAAALGVGDRLVLAGTLAHPEVLALIGAADAVAMPSVRDDRGNIDGLPIVVLEAMAAGRPLVASDIAGIPLAVTDGETGLLVPERDPAALAAALGRVIDDRELASRLGQAARERVGSELTWTRIAARHDEIWRQLQGPGA
jgi:glycosyltransferase involved in cell wall biosynthesis